MTLPELSYYGGFSGMATGAVTYFCIQNALKKSKNRIIWLIILACSVIKIWIEIATEMPIFVKESGTYFRVLPSVHLFGFLGALILAILVQTNRDINR
jgi:hypothetical protein